MRRLLGLALGLAFSVTQAPAVSAQNLLTNGGFETGDFSGWTQWGDTGFSGVDGFNPHSGSYGAYFGNVTGLGGIFQGVATNAGQRYLLSFWLGNGSGTPNYFDVFWNSVMLTSLVNVGPFGYTQFAFEVEGTGFDFIDFGFQHSPSFWDLDDVSLVAIEGSAVPEPISMVLLGTGLAAVVAVRRRRRLIDA